MTPDGSTQGHCPVWSVEALPAVYLCCRLCGHSLKSNVITSQSNQMTIKFNSDSSYVDQGFTAEYEAFIPTNRKTDVLSVSFNRPISKANQQFLDSSPFLNFVLIVWWYWSACPGRFQCSDNLCINRTLQCDGWSDCGDDSDEADCSESNICGDVFFLKRESPVTVGLPLNRVWCDSDEV